MELMKSRDLPVLFKFSILYVEVLPYLYSYTGDFFSRFLKKISKKRIRRYKKKIKIHFCIEKESDFSLI